MAYRFGVACCAALVPWLGLTADGQRAMGYRPPRVRIAIERQAAPSGTKTRSAVRLGATPSLPSKWDSRDHGWVSSVKNQGNVGACWAFAACAVLETQLLKAGRGEWDLSEKNMVNNNGYLLTPDEGGNDYMVLAYLMRWSGAVAESNDVYKTSMSSWTPSPQLMPIVKVQNVVWVPGRTNYTDNAVLKTAIMTHGAVSTSLYWHDTYSQSGNYYCAEWKDCNHAVAVIGWDDSYPASNFKNAPQGDGAFIIKNSWGRSLGKKGYWYVSYYDENFAMVEGSVFIPATDAENYDAVYGYDTLGAIGVTDNSDKNTLEAAVFTSAWNEEIAAVGVYSNIDGNTYEVSVWTNVTRTADTGSPNPLAGGTLAAKVSGAISKAGYATIPLSQAVKIADGTNFAVVYRQTGGKHPHIFCCSDTDDNGNYYVRVDAQPGNTYWGKPSYRGTNWTDLAVHATYPNSIACLKAYTRTTVSERDLPAEPDDGTAALEWLAETNAVLYAETSASFGAFAGLVGANGRTLWASYVTGFDPADPDDGNLEVMISVTNGVPYLTWTPDLGASARKYTIWGRRSLDGDSSWETPTNSLHRFFKVGVDMK